MTRENDIGRKNKNHESGDTLKIGENPLNLRQSAFVLNF